MTLTIDSLVDEHFEYLCRYAGRYFRSPEIVEDIVQECFVAAFEKFETFEGRSSVRTWLTGIIRHKIFDVIRQGARTKEVEIDSLDRELMAKLFDENEHWRNDTGPLLWGSSPDEMYKQKEFLVCVEKCLARLPEKIRQIFCLRELEDLPRDEICEKFSISVTNVGVILHRARLSIQQCLQNSWFKAVRGES